MYSIIKEVTFKISSYCNLSCSYCFQTEDIKRRRDTFADYEALATFIERLPLKGTLEIKMTGGEVSLFPHELRRAVGQLRRVERKRDVRLRPTVISNGTNVNVLLKLLNEGVLYAHGTKISWDGIFSASKSRKPKDKRFDDCYFEEQIKRIGRSPWRRDILIRTAVTEETVDDLHESLQFLLMHGCRKWEYYFISDYPAYATPDFLMRFRTQLERIAEDYVSCYRQRETRWTYGNWDALFFTRFQPKTLGKQRAVSCRHLGRGLYIAYDGSVLPCGFFDGYSNYTIGSCDGPAPLYTLGNIYDGIDPKTTARFVQEYLDPPMCDYTACGNLHCFECPAVNRKNLGRLNARHCNTCGLLTAEREVFERWLPLLPIDNLKETAENRYSFIKSWNMNKFSADGYLRLPMKGETHV